MTAYSLLYEGVSKRELTKKGFKDFQETAIQNQEKRGLS